MQTPQDVEAMLRLKAAGWGRRRIAKELGCSPETVRRYLKQGGWVSYGRPCRPGLLDQHRDWLRQRFLRHRGNADVVRQELLKEHGIRASLRTVERAVAPWRQELKVAALATVRFETPPGKQLQADFGQCVVAIAGEPVRIHLCVLTLGYSRRLYVRAFQRERQLSWLEAIEEAFFHWGGVPRELLIDNARALVTHHDSSSGEVVYSERLRAFAAYWGFRPRACRPYRARTKGKDERGVGYVKGNATAGRQFSSWEALEAHLVQWTREVADVRVHGTTGEQPLQRFMAKEVQALQPLPHKPSFLAERELIRVVHNDACVEVEGNWYSVPWQLLSEKVTVRLRDQQVVILRAGRIVATHPRLQGKKKRQLNPAHWQGLVPTRPPQPPSDSGHGLGRKPAVVTGSVRIKQSELGRPLAVYAAVAGELQP